MLSVMLQINEYDDDVCGPYYELCYTPCEYGVSSYRLKGLIL